MAQFKQGKWVAAVHRLGRVVATFALTQWVTMALMLGAMLAGPPSYAAANQTSSAPLQACVLPAKWHHLCIPPITKSAWQKRYHCTFCAVTMDDLEKALPHASKKTLDTIFDDLNGHMVKYGLDSPARLMNFFAQVEAETGFGSTKMLVESDNYAVGRLFGLRYFKSHRAKACEYGRLTKADTKRIAQCKALDLKGKHKEWWTPHAANQQAIADIWYDGSLGNGKYPSNDGWTYRGRGMLQITHKDTYAKESKFYNAMYHPAVPIDFVKAPDLLGQADYAFKASVGYWLGNGIEKAADITDFTNPCPASDAVTKKVNGGAATEKTKQNRCQLLKNLTKTGAFGEVACHLPDTAGPKQPPGVPLPPSPPMPPLPPVKRPPGSSPPIRSAAQSTQAPPFGSAVH